MLRLVTWLVLSLLSLSAIAQTPDLGAKIQAYNNSKADLISKGRQMLLDTFLSGNLPQVQAIVTYFHTSIDDSMYASLLKYEERLLAYWLQDYAYVLQDVQQFDSTAQRIYRNKILPQDETLSLSLRRKSIAYRDSLERNIAASAMTTEEKAFTRLLLTRMLWDKAAPTPHAYLNGLNAAADTFLTTYPQSVYGDFVRRVIRYQVKPAKWWLDAHFYSGVIGYTGQLAQNFRTGLAFGVAFDIHYQKWVLQLHDFLGATRTIRPQPFDTTVWAKDANVTIFIPEAAIGYTLLDHNRLRIIPFAGLASASFAPTSGELDRHPAYAAVGLNFTTTYTAGLNLDYRLGKASIPLGATRPEYPGAFLRLRCSYNSPQFSRKYTGYDGDMFSLTVGLGFGGRAMKRTY